MKKVILIANPVTGQTPIYSDVMRKEFEQHIHNKEWECYCLDAPLYINDGVTKAPFRAGKVSGEVVGQQFGQYRG